jgi:hypothetical protein
MNLPHRQSKPLPERLLQTAAAGAGTVRLAIRQRTLRPRAIRRKRMSLVSRITRHA